MNGGDTHVQSAPVIARDTEGAYKTLDHSERYRDDRSAHAQWRLRGGFNGRQGPRSSRARSGFDVVERPRAAARKICWERPFDRAVGPAGFLVASLTADAQWRSRSVE